MSTYSIPVTGPDPRLAMLRALALKTRAHLTRAWTTTRIILTSTTRYARAAATTALAVLGHPAGYHVVRHAVRSATTLVARVARSAGGLLRRGLAFFGGLVTDAASSVAPELTHTITSRLDGLVGAPVRRFAHTVSSWLSDVGNVLWALSGTGLVRAATTRTAQAASVVLGIHTLTQGAAAARIVQILPWTMDAVLTLTNPLWVLAGVGVAFTASLALAALRLTRRPSPTPDPETDTSRLIDPSTPDLPTTPRLVSAETDYRRLISNLNIEITPNGTVLVHGIPDDIPRDLGTQLAAIAADAAAARLERILLHRTTPTRDDRRLLTKVAREAVRVHARRLTTQHATA